MAQHKAPTDVTIASTTEESDLHLLVRKYWPLATGVALAATAGIIYVQWSGQAALKDELSSWERLGATVALDNPRSAPADAELAALVEELAETPAGPWARAVEIGKRVAEEDAEGARLALAGFKQQWPEHLLATAALFPRPEGEDGPPRRLADHVDAQITALEAWEAAHPHLFANPPLPEDAPRVRLETSEGVIVIGLYEEQAPEHTANFVKLATEGFYDGVKFHRVVPGKCIQGGDPNTRDDEAQASWGQGGPGYTLEPAMGELWHFKGAVAAAATAAAGPTSGSQFYIVIGDDAHNWDGSYTVFGAVVEGQEVADRIGSAPLVGERPEEPVEILSATAL